jgi:hypothetical protein
MKPFCDLLKLFETLNHTHTHTHEIQHISWCYVHLSLSQVSVLCTHLWHGRRGGRVALMLSKATPVVYFVEAGRDGAGALRAYCICAHSLGLLFKFRAHGSIPVW